MDDNITIEPSPAGKGRKRLVNKQEWKREKAKSKINQKDLVSVKCSIDISRGHIPVCKKTFVSVVGIGKNRIERILKQYHETGVLPAERRGDDRVPKKSMHKKQAIKNFIEAL
nr:unnamed protein product [Callosobruchus chinensis]